MSDVPHIIAQLKSLREAMHYAIAEPDIACLGVLWDKPPPASRALRGLAYLNTAIVLLAAYEKLSNEAASAARREA